MPQSPLRETLRGVKISVTIPRKVEERNIAGDGWTLELKDGYAVVKEEKTGNYKLIKK